MVNNIYVAIKPHETKPYSPKLISIVSNRIEGCRTNSSMGHYLGYCTEALRNERLTPIQAAIEKYNAVITHLWELPGFSDFFTEHNFILSKNNIEKRYGKDVAEFAFTLPKPAFCLPDIVIKDDYLFWAYAGYVAIFDYSGDSYQIHINGADDGYPEELNNKVCFWNWVDGDTDFAIGFVNYITSNLPQNVHISQGPLYDFDCYDQWRGTPTPASELIRRIFKLISHHGYLEKYKVLAESNSVIWNYFTETKDDSVGLYLCDKRAFRDKLLIAKINALMDACTIEYDDNDSPVYGALVDHESESFNVNQPFYFLQDKDDITFISKVPGLLGGHKKLRIYGRLDCPSANRHVDRGQYIAHRVFFADENTAVAAGYRPCAKCMKEEYLIWKSK